MQIVYFYLTRILMIKKISPIFFCCRFIIIIIFKIRVSKNSASKKIIAPAQAR